MLVVARQRKSEAKPAPQLGPNLRRLRTAKGLSGEKLEELSGVHRVTISEIERGNADTSTETLAKLARGLEVTPSELLAVPLNEAPIEPLIQAFLKSPWAAVMKPDVEELEWLRSRPGTFWFGIEPSPAVLAKAIEMRREDRKK